MHFFLSVIKNKSIITIKAHTNSNQKSTNILLLEEKKTTVKKCAAALTERIRVHWMVK